MSDKFNDLVRLLRELFQLDQPDLDFGLYRIMHAKSGEVTQFLEKDLLPQVKKAFEQYQPADKAAIKKKLDQAVAAAESLGVDPDTNEKVLQLRAELTEGADLEAMESEVYDHLYSFFRRYYSEGDFLAKRVYKPGVYAVPYEGEEVVLHWANKDQYYIKTSEYLRDYAFRLKPDAGDAGGDPMRVHFRLVAAAEGEHGNNKAAEGKDRVFVLAPAGESGQDFLIVETVDGREELVIGFEYRPATMDDWTDGAKAQASAAAKKKPPKQKDLIDIAVKAVLETTGDAFDGWITELVKPHTKVNGETADYSRLEGHLSRYCARHTFDYFIHKDLGGFLRRELDFYIKNEVMHLDDVQNEDAPKVEQYLSKIKVIRTIAGKVIDFLHQLEEFQLKLWLKKKFVTETFYCLRLGVIPKDFYAEIAANQAQHDEWVALCRIDRIDQPSNAPQYSNPLTVEYLENMPSLVVDTRHFADSFTHELLEAIGDLPSLIKGLAIHSDNWQALRVLQNRFRSGIQSVYIDPPYNTGHDGFVYKDAFQSSTWAAMIRDRLEVASSLLCDTGIHFASINEIERSTLEWQSREAFGHTNRVEELVWVRDTVSNNAPTYSTNHEYIQVFCRDLRAVEACKPLFRATRPGYVEVMDLIDALGPDYPSIEEAQQALRDLYKRHQREHRAIAMGQGETKEQAQKSDPWKGLYPYKWLEYRDGNGKAVAEQSAASVSASLWVFREVEPSMPSGKQADSIRDPESENYRFYSPINPISNLPCKGPKRGWAFPEKASGKRPSFEGYVADDRIVFKDGEAIPQLKYFLHEVESVVATSVIRQYADGEPQLEALFGAKGLIDNPKPPGLVQTLVSQTTFSDEVVLDYFAGSGTTAQAVIQQNAADGGSRSFIVVEMGEHFDSVLVPRIKKVTFSPLWDAGTPASHADAAHLHAAPAITQCIRLESYEDAVAGLHIDQQDDLSEMLANVGSATLREDYVLKYLLPTITSGNNSLLNISEFKSPDEYRLSGRTPGSDQNRMLRVDLIETFNWLLGLRVSGVSAPKSFSAKFDRDKEGRLAVKGRIKEDPDGPWWFRTVTGTTPDGKRALIIWRKRPGGDEPEGIEQDNAVLDAWFRTQKYSTSDSEFDIVWVNGDNNLANLRQEDTPDDGLGETGWKVRIIEQDFHRLMFDTSDVPGGA